MIRYLLLVLLAVQMPQLFATESKVASSWNAAKNLLDDKVYSDHKHTFYCGCTYSSDNDKDSSGTIDADACGLGDVALKRDVRNTIQWEHIVPASLMPVRSYRCWVNPKSVEQCMNSDGTAKYSGRECCERTSTVGRAMIFDLFNLTPSSAQLNQYRSNDPYGEIPDDQPHEGFGCQCQAKDLNGTKAGPGGLFEPPPCKKGDVARVWFYMRDTHGVQISAAMEAMFKRWSTQDPVSPWEKVAHDRTAAIQMNSNPYVANAVTSAKGSCSWEK